MNNLPRPIEPMVTFSQRLRAAGFAVSTDQTMGFIEAVGVLGPRDLNDLYRAGLALFAVPPERREEYAAVFRSVFMGQQMVAPATGDGNEEVEVHEPTGSSQEADADEGVLDTSFEASVLDRDGYRALSSADSERALTLFSARLEARLPRRTSYRRKRAARGQWIDVRRTLREAARREGDVLKILKMRRVIRARKLLLLIDVSGSMATSTEGMLRLAHAVVQGAPRAEVFTLGTRLTRITAALAPVASAQALSRAAAVIGDIDGGTRLGAAVQAFLDVPRYGAFARGAAVAIVSDGLERESPEILVDAVRRLSRLAWRVDWLSPLAADPEFRPETQAMAAVMPYLSSIGVGSDELTVAEHILNMAKAA